MINLRLSGKYKSLDTFTQDIEDLTILTGINGSGKTQIISAINEGSLQVYDLIKDKQITSIVNATLVQSERYTYSREQYVQDINESFRAYDIVRALYNPSTSVFNSDSTNSDLITKISKGSGRNPWELTNDDFFKYSPISKQNGVFIGDLSKYFLSYYIKYEDNDYNRLKGYSSISDEEFFELYGPIPWDKLNEFLSYTQLDYRVVSPSGNHRDAPFTLKIINTISNSELTFEDLSSGEKVLMAIGISLFNQANDYKFPDLLLMDEPDASLHPSMSKLFIDIITDYFIKIAGIKVLIATHSPSTVAFAPEESIYVVNKQNPRIEKTSKDRALRILTSGVPSFSINYENRRQVFVESLFDVVYYERIYNFLTPNLEPEVSLSFISSGDTRTDKNGIRVSNCEQVKHVTNILRESGNKFVWGIVDWDLKNKQTDYIKVLGFGIRYNIESYIFDPLFIAFLLLMHKEIPKEAVGLLADETYTDFRYFDSKKLQQIVDYIINRLKSHFANTTDEWIECTLVNSNKIVIPKWYLQCNGHDLEDIITSEFAKLGVIKRGKEDVLKLEIIDKVISEIPQLLSSDILSLFKTIQTE